MYYTDNLDIDYIYLKIMHIIDHIPIMIYRPPADFFNGR